jgi:hypothetical protein
MKKFKTWARCKLILLCSFISENVPLLTLCLIGTYWGWSGVLLGAVLGYLIPWKALREKKRTEKALKYCKRHRYIYEDVNPATGLPMSGGVDAAGNPYGCDFQNHPYDDCVNPATGLPMVGGEAGVDVEGNLYGSDTHNL